MNIYKSGKIQNLVKSGENADVIRGKQKSM